MAPKDLRTPVISTRPRVAGVKGGGHQRLLPVASTAWVAKNLRAFCSGVSGQVAHRSLGVVPFDVVLEDAEHGGDHHVPEGGHQEQRQDLLGAVVDDLHGVEELRVGQDVDDRGALDQADDLVEGGGQDGTHGLRQDDPGGPAPGRDAQGGSGLQLALVHGEDAAADDFRGVGGLVQGQAQDGSGKLADQRGGLDFEEPDIGERDAQADLFVEVAQVVPEQHLHQQRRGPEDPGERPGHGHQQRGGGQPHQRQDEAQHKAEDAGDGGELQRFHQAVDDRLRGEPLRHHAPLPARVGGQRPGHGQHAERHGGGAHPAPRMLGSHHAV